ncbi:acyl-CoA carboxylase subunit epsilon [Streptomyces sp. NPDC051211]|uniref:acyl-CoA carboxylase subunit epsilon n=1 Tax=Streptomyces sp. NPDC051211 TaxID=3154643 RepID=UPI00344FA813
MDGRNGGTLVRVERGLAEAEELAAVTVVLLSLLAGRGDGDGDAGDGRSAGAATWKPPESGYRSPRSWQ